MTYCCNAFAVTDINTSQDTASPKASLLKHLIMSLNKQQVSGLLQTGNISLLLLWSHSTCFSHRNFQSYCV